MQPALAMSSQGEPPHHWDVAPPALVPGFVAGFPGPAALLSEEGVVEANAAGQALIEGLTESLPQPPAQVRVAQGAQLFDLTLVPLDGGLILLVARDATLDRNLIEALGKSRQLFRDLVLCSSDFAFEVDLEGRFGFVSPRGALGYDAGELSGRPVRHLSVDPEGPWPFDGYNDEVRLMGRDGQVRLFAVSAIAVNDRLGRPAGARGVARDVTEERARDAALEEAHRREKRLARTDGLTGLYNRRAFVKELGIRLAHLQRHGRTGALLYLDLDNFKAVNDTNGHAAGDACLKTFASELRRCSRVGDSAARLGGDEFALWLEEIDGPAAMRKAETVLACAAALDAQYGVPGRPLGVSVGVALSGPNDDAAALMARSDVAMYRAKQGGKGRAALAEPNKEDSDAGAPV